MSREYLLYFAQAHEDFRLPELDSLCELLQIQIHYDRQSVDLHTPFMRVRMDREDDARRLGSRCVLLKAIYELWAQGPSYEDVFHIMQHESNSRALWQIYQARASFRITVQAYGATIPIESKQKIIESLSWLDFQGEIIMKHPEVEICVLEDWTGAPTDKSRHSETQRRGIWVGKKICDGQRNLIDVFDVKKRVYIGNTSMAADMSLIMANQAKASKGCLIYDPFVGTGSMLYTSGYFGALVVGTDIDGRMIRGKASGTGILDSATQYGIRDRVVDCMVCDLNSAPWRTGALFDAIVTDPPYGVRAGAKRLGRKDPSKLRDQATVMPDGSLSHERVDYVPPAMPWEMSEVLVELLRQSHALLKLGGRLVYWLPTVPAEYKDTDVPTMEGMKLIANSEQNFGKWARRLITMEKVDSEGTKKEEQPGTTNQPAHYDFRNYYFGGRQ